MTVATDGFVPRPGPAALPGVPHAAPFLIDLTVAAEHMGTVVEHVDNVAYVRWLDRAAELHADALGFTRARLLERGIMWFVGRHEIDYLAETHLGDRLVIATWVRSAARVKSWRDTLIVTAEDHRPVCRASTLWVLVDLASRRPARIPPDMAARFVPLETPAPAGRRG